MIVSFASLYRLFMSLLVATSLAGCTGHASVGQAKSTNASQPTHTPGHPGHPTTATTPHNALDINLSLAADALASSLASSDLLKKQSSLSLPTDMVVSQIENRTGDKWPADPQWLFAHQLVSASPVIAMGKLKNANLFIEPSREAKLMTKSLLPLPQDLRHLQKKGQALSIQLPPRHTTHYLVLIFKKNQAGQYYLEYAVREMTTGYLAWKSSFRLHINAQSNQVVRQ